MTATCELIRDCDSYAESFQLSEVPVAELVRRAIDKYLQERAKEIK